MSQAAALSSPRQSVARVQTLERRARWWATLTLLIMFGLALTSMGQKAPTFDEQGFIVRGLAYLRGDTHIRVGHPPGLNALNAAFLAADEGVRLPIDDPSWSDSSFHRPAELFLWEIGNDVDHVMFLARLPTLWLGLLLAALAGRWAWEISRKRWIGLLALIFIAFDPNILAHSRLATTDLGLTAFALLSAYTLWRFLSAPSWPRVLVAGAAFGLLQNTKFTAGLFLLLFALVMVAGLVQLWHKRTKAQRDPSAGASAFPSRPLFMLLVGFPLAAFFTLWATNGFDISTLPTELPIMADLAGKTVPLAHYLEQLLDIGGRLQVTTPSFLLGQYSDTGWWYYFPIAFLLKTPVPTLILLLWGSIAFVACIFGLRRRGYGLPVLDSAALLVPGIGFFLIAMTTDINLGYRHILPALPFLVVFAAVAIAAAKDTLEQTTKIFAAALLSLWLLFISLILYPDYLAFFNVLARGPDNGWRALVDSNLDWGQDLDDLPLWMADNDVEMVWLSYFGEARPEYYGLRYKGLDSFPPRLMDPEARPFAPSNPSPGIYAISATNLQGVHFADHDQFAWFRERDPLDKLGYSIFLYDVPSYGEPATLLLSGVQLDEIEPEDLTLLETNDVRARWFDLNEALIIPDTENIWLARIPGQEPSPAIAPFLDGQLDVVTANDKYQLARYEPLQRPNGVMAEFTHGNGRILLQDAEFNQLDDSRVILTSRWRQQGEAQPLKIFVHATDPAGQIVAQWDGLGANWRGWLPGDTLVQVHTLTLPDDLPSESVEITMGVYDPVTGQRWLTFGGSDHIQLNE